MGRPLPYKWTSDFLHWTTALRYVEMVTRLWLSLLFRNKKRLGPRQQQYKSWPARLTLAADSICIERDLRGAHLLQLRHPCFQRFVAHRLHRLVPLPQHLSNPHHGEPAPAFNTVGAAQRVVGNQLSRGHSFLLGGVCFFFICERDLVGVDGGCTSWLKKRGQCPFT